MNHRDLHKAAKIAVEVRKLQDQAALLKLQIQQIAVSSATQAYDAALDAEADSQDAWRLSIEGPVFDPDLMTAWHHRTQETAEQRASCADRLRVQQDLASDRKLDWHRQLCLTQAATSVLRKTEKRTQRLAEETQLAAAEDMRNARWGYR